jgi:hypothetical protein
MLIVDIMNTSTIYEDEQKKHINDVFWVDEPSILYHPDRLIEFIPTGDMSNSERLNAITRFFIYLSILLYIIYRRFNLLFIGIIACFVIYVISYNEKKNQITNKEQFENKIKEELNIDKDTPIKVNELGDICQLPTPNNPFMNILMTDYTDNPNRPPACANNDEQSKEATEKYFNYNLYKDVEDVWGKRNSQREFVTMPGTTIPNDRDTFMKWCWKTTYVCKDGDLNYCLQNEDMRVPGNS